MNNCVRLRLGAVASAIALTGSLASIEAHALALGRVTVQSALGEPLRAEIDITEITADEASSLRAGVASAEAFRTAGLEYSPVVMGLQVTLQKRPDGRSYLRLSSTRTVIEPFVDLVLDASWSTGRVVRDYTMLFDPPSLRQAAPVAPTAPIISRPAAPSGTGVGSIPPSPPAATAAPLPPRQQPASRARVEQAAPRPAASGQRVAVKPGDTAGKIAAQNKPASISLDQMLAALIRSNPDAFIGGNVNRLKSGAVLDIPGADQAGSISPAEASRTIVAQSREFNDFRRKLAEGVPVSQVANANREAGGKVQAKVEDRATATAAPDKLTLSKGAIQGKTAVEEKIAKERQAKEASDRVAELTKNIGDLSKITGAATAASASTTARAPGIVIPAPVAIPAPVVAASAQVSAAKPAASAAAILAATPAASASATSDVSSTMAAASAAKLAVIAAGAASAPVPAASSVKGAQVVTPVLKPVAVTPPPRSESGLVAQFTDNLPLVGGIAALLALLASLGIYRLRRKRVNGQQVDSSFLESRLQPDSFFDASGGHRIDTNERGGTGSSLVYSPSQLDATGDVDPIAEADVYLAYGRDLQAEEILKEALRTNPTRITIYAKLLEIYAKRRDAKAFEVMASEAFKLTQGEGSDWAYIGKMGRELDPANSLYLPGGRPASAGAAGAAGAAAHTAASATANDEFNAASAAFASSTLPQLPDPAVGDLPFPPSFDLDLDFSVAERAEAAASPAAVAPSYQPQPPVAASAPKDSIFGALEMDFPADMEAQKPGIAGRLTPDELPTPNTGASSLASNGLDFTAEPIPTTAKPAVAPATAPSATNSGMLEFDLASLSLDLDKPAIKSPTLGSATSDKTPVDPLETKFLLAEEFRALGDADGARSLAEEVVTQASGPLKIRAQAFINSLS